MVNQAGPPPSPVPAHHAAPAGAGPPIHAAASPSPFRQLLSELNPLQYVPLVGGLYRAATGDRIPDNARIMGSLVVSGLTGGPIGIAANIALLAAEKATGIDPERMEGNVLSSVGIGKKPSTPAATRPATPKPAAIQPATAATATAAATSRSPLAFSAAQLSAYGAVASAGGGIKTANLSGSDVLNAMELDRLGGSTALA
jgi:hypothetical protein